MANGSALEYRVLSGETTAAAVLGTLKLICCVLFPFVTGYFLSYYFRTVNTVLSTRLIAEISLTAAQLGLMTAAYFLTAAAAQIPIGWALDRFGPRKVQILSLTIAAGGAVLFALARDVATLFTARALIGLGVASALLAGLKAIAMISPPARLGLYNGIYMGIGALGALVASAPTEWLLQIVDWRQLFWILAAASLASAAIIGVTVPRGFVVPAGSGMSVPRIGYRQVLKDGYFWRLAPLSATAIGGAWALQGLWSAPWLRDVAAMTAPQVAQYLLIMALSLSMGALCFGLILHRLAAAGIPPSHTMGAASLIFIAAETALAIAWPVPPLMCWCLISAFAAGTVLTYTMSAQHFPKESVGRANSAFNLLHFAAAFAVQSGFGAIVALWPRNALGHYPAEAYSTAFLCLIAIQIPALLWFLRPDRSEKLPSRPSPLGSKIQRVTAWILLLCVINHVLGPLHGQLTTRLTLRAPALAVSTPPDRVPSLERLEGRLQALESRIYAREQELAKIMRELRQLSERDRWTHQLLDDVGDSLLNLNEAACALDKRVSKSKEQ